MLRIKRNNIKTKYPKEFNEIKAFVQMRDKNICCGCNRDVSSEKFFFHHIDANINNNNISNIATVCIKCHGNIHSIGLIDLKIDKNWKIPKIKFYASINAKRSNLMFR